MARSFLSVIVMTGTVLGLSGCETIGNPFDVLSGKKQSPDEFQVLARKPLRMPGSLALPEPRLGEVSPLEPDPNTDAVIALLGAPIQRASTGTSAGEQQLLGAANTAANQSEIRTLLEQDEQTIDENKPYEPPSIFELLSPSGETKPENVIDPAAEARRLQTEGVSAAPIDPDDNPNPEPLITSEGPDLYYETDDGKPNNKLPSASTETAF